MLSEETWTSILISYSLHRKSVFKNPALVFPTRKQLFILLQIE